MDDLSENKVFTYFFCSKLNSVKLRWTWLLVTSSFSSDVIRCLRLYDRALYMLLVITVLFIFYVFLFLCEPVVYSLSVRTESLFHKHTCRDVFVQTSKSLAFLLSPKVVSKFATYYCTFVLWSFHFIYTANFKKVKCKCIKLL